MVAVLAPATGKATAVLAQVTEQVVVLAGMGTIPGSDLVMEPVTAALVPATALVTAEVTGQVPAALVQDMDLATATDLAMAQGKAVMAQVTVQAAAGLVPAAEQGTIRVRMPEPQAAATPMPENG